MIDKKDLSLRENSKCLNLGATARQSGHLENEPLAVNASLGRGRAVTAWIVGPAEKRGDLGRETHLVDSIGKDLPVSHSQSTARPGKQARKMLAGPGGRPLIPPEHQAPSGSKKCGRIAEC